MREKECEEEKSRAGNYATAYAFSQGAYALKIGKVGFRGPTDWRWSSGYAFAFSPCVHPCITVTPLQQCRRGGAVIVAAMRTH